MSLVNFYPPTSNPEPYSMKTKNRSLLVLSLLICCCCSLHAVPSEPTAPPPVTDPATPDLNPLVLTEENSGQSYNYKTSQESLQIELMSDVADDPFTFKDSSLPLNSKKRPYIFQWNGLTDTEDSIDYDIFKNKVEYYSMNENFDILNKIILKTDYIPLIHDFIVLKDNILII